MTKVNELFTIILCLIFCIWASSNVCAEKVKTVALNPWNLRNENGSIQVNGLKTPTGVYTALKDKYGDVLNSKNDVDLRWIVNQTWIFSTKFSALLDHTDKINLTFHGIDTVATIRLNNERIGETINMFVRYSFDVKHLLKDEENLLEIDIKSPILEAKARADDLMAQGINTPPNCPHDREKGECHRNMLRKMQTSFGGDWNLAAPSMGIWKAVELEYYEVAIMREVDVAIRRNETHWTLDIRAFLSSGLKQHFYADLKFIAAELQDAPLLLKPRLILYSAAKIEFLVHVPQENVSLWWPNGYGAQKLYPLYMEVQCWVNGSSSPNMISRTRSQKMMNIGFRTIELGEDLDDYGRNFHFKVNEQPIFIKGASYVPSHILPEFSYSHNRLEHLMRSAKDTHLNMIRVWGGGLYESDEFYNLTDYYGLLVWQEMAFSGATYPMTNEFVETVRVEVSQNAKRISFHPSLAIIVLNDEIELYFSKNKTELGEDSQRLEDEYKQLFMGTLRHELNVISRNDFNPRAGPMISTPSMGVEESKKDLSTDPQSHNYGDYHFWDDSSDGWDPKIYPPARFITEYGFQSLPIMTSWNRTLAAEDDLNAIVRHRQHDPNGFLPIFSLIWKHFNIPIMDWERHIDKVSYLSQITQAMAVKVATDVFRSQRRHKRTMGAMYWQLNDAWVAPSWSSVDYFGNYKLIWYWSKQFMAPTTIIALLDTDRINVTIVKDELVLDIEEPEEYNITMYTYLWSELFHRKAERLWEVNVTSNGMIEKILPSAAAINRVFTKENSFMKFELSNINGTVASTYLFPETQFFKVDMANPEIKVDLSWHYSLKSDIVFYSLTVTVKKPALFVYLEIYHPDVEKYKLSDNGFVLTDPIKVIHAEIELKEGVNIETWSLAKENVSVMTMNQFYVGDSSSSMTSTEVKTSTVATTTGRNEIEEVVETETSLQLETKDSVENI